MSSLYQDDLAYAQAVGFSEMAARAATEIIRRLRLAGAQRIVEVGCGAGPLTAALTAEGFEVTAIEQSAALLGYARANAPEGRFIHGSVYDVELPACDAVIGVGEVFNYHRHPEEGRERVFAYFEQVRRVLPKGGLFIFDVIESGRESLTANGHIEGDGWSVAVETIERDGELDRLISTSRRVGDRWRRSEERHRVYLFDRNDAIEELQRLGFAVETSSFYGSLAMLRRRRAFFCEVG